MKLNGLESYYRNKCTENGYQKIVMCCDILVHSINIKEKSLSKLTDSNVSKVSFMEFREISKYLMQFETNANTHEEKIIKGYRVKVKYK